MNTCLFDKAFIERTPIVSEHLPERDSQPQPSMNTCLLRDANSSSMVAMRFSSCARSSKCDAGPIIRNSGGHHLGARWSTGRPSGDAGYGEDYGSVSTASSGWSCTVARTSSNHARSNVGPSQASSPEV